jgi:hypothetical protein
LSRSKSCINKTSECWRACYGHGIRYQSNGARSKRFRNFETVEFLLEHGGTEALAEHLVDLIDRARPCGWLIAKASGFLPAVPWSLRLMDVGDFHRLEFVQAWAMAARSRPECLLWWYTRSYVDNEMFNALSEFASLPNVQGWLSIDSDNFKLGIERYASSRRGIWKVALMQPHPEQASAVLIDAIRKAVPPSDLMIFPEHRAGHHVPPIHIGSAPVCPQVLGALPLQKEAGMPRPCQTCRLCLPA